MCKTEEKLLLLLDILRDIRDCNKKQRKLESICNMFSIVVIKHYRSNNLSYYFNLYSLYGLLRDLGINWKDYPNYSGVPFYPVKHPINPNPTNAYNNCSNFWYGAYGKERYKLLDWLITQVKLKLSQYP